MHRITKRINGFECFAEPGSAFSTTDHWVVPAGECPASVAETTPGVAVIARGTSAARSVAATTRVGSVSPLGKCAASVW